MILTEQLDQLEDNFSAFLNDGYFFHGSRKQKNPLVTLLIFYNFTCVFSLYILSGFKAHSSNNSQLFDWKLFRYHTHFKIIFKRNWNMNMTIVNTENSRCPGSKTFQIWSSRGIWISLQIANLNQPFMRLDLQMIRIQKLRQLERFLWAYWK